MLGTRRRTSLVLEALATGVLRLGARLSGDTVPPEVHGGGWIVIGNHRSVADVVVGTVLLRGGQAPARYMVKGSFFERRLQGWFLRRMEAIPVPVDAVARSALRDATDALAAGQNVVIMPEGRVAPAGIARTEVLPFSGGLDLLARRSGAPVLAVAIRGVDDLWPADRKLPVRRSWRRPTIDVRMEVLPPVTGRNATTEQAEATIRRLLAELEGRAGP